MLERDDVARKRFLDELVAALGDAWVPGYAEVTPFGVMGLTLRREGFDGFVQVVASVVHDNVISWSPFPGTGTPHYDLKFGGGTARTCILAEAVAILEGWVRRQQPVTRSKPVPMLDVMRPRLEAIARAPLATFDDAGLEVERWQLTPSGQTTLDEVRRAIVGSRVVRAFPRDDDGRLALATQALLAELESTARLKEGRSVHVVVRGPRVRRDGDRLQLAIEDVNAANQSHDWRRAPWLWRDGHEAPALDERALACAALLDAGRFDEALAMYDISLSEPAIRTLEGQTGSRHASEDREVMRRTLWALAPWQLAGLGHGGQLALLSHQTTQRKCWIVWSRRVIDIQVSASNGRLPEVLWKRPVDVDLERLGITRAPVAPAQRTTKASRARAPRPEPTLDDALAGKALWKATRALELAKRRPHADAWRELIAIAQGPGDATARANAVWILGEIALDADRPALAVFLDDPSDDVQRMAIEAVKRTHHVEAIPQLARHVTEARAWDFLAVTAMKSLSGKRGPAGLAHWLDHADPRVREAACIGFVGSLEGHKLARAPLERCAADPDPAVAAAAARALASIASAGID